MFIRIRNRKKVSRRLVKNSGEGTKETYEEKKDSIDDAKIDIIENQESFNVENIDEDVIFVMPGDLIATAEELQPGDGTFNHVSDIYASTTGIVKIDKKSRTISVIPKTNIPPAINVNNIVVGLVVGVKDTVALIDIAAIKDEGEREFPKTGNAAVHVSNVKDSYCKRLDDEFAIGDIIKARVINTENMRLSTAEKELGVMKAHCSNCRTILLLEDNSLKCPECGRTEKRKLSSDYGTGIV